MILKLIVALILFINICNSQNIKSFNQIGNIGYVTFEQPINITDLVISNYDSIPDSGIMVNYNQDTFSVKKGSLFYDLSNLAKNSNTGDPYIAYYEGTDVAGDFKYATYFNLFGKLDYCHTFNTTNQTVVYQSCIVKIKGKYGNYTSQAGGVSVPVQYDFTVDGTVKIIYFADETSNCKRNTTYNIICNEYAINYTITNMTQGQDPCAYVIYMESKFACPINRKIPLTQTSIDSISFEITKNSNEPIIKQFYINGEKYNCSADVISQVETSTVDIFNVNYTTVSVTINNNGEFPIKSLRLDVQGIKGKLKGEIGSIPIKSSRQFKYDQKDYTALPNIKYYC